MGKLSVSPALVLRHVDYRDADRVVTLFTRDLGRISGLARGVRRSTKRFGGRLDLFTLAEVQFREGRGLYHLESATLLSAHLGIRADLLRISWAAHLSELTQKLCAEEQPHPRAFQVLARAMAFLSDAREVDEGALRGAELALLMDAGYSPELDACVVCRRPVGGGGRFHFVVTRGGCVCDRCMPGPSGIPVAEEVCTRLSEAARAWPDETKVLGLDEVSLRQAREILDAFVGYHVGGRMKSARMLQDLLSSPGR